MGFFIQFSKFMIKTDGSLRKRFFVRLASQTNVIVGIYTCVMWPTDCKQNTQIAYNRKLNFITDDGLFKDV